MNYAICLGLFLPLVGFFVLAMGGKYFSRQHVGFFACGVLLLSFLSFLGLLVLNVFANVETTTLTLFPWIPIEGIEANAKLVLDSLSLMMCLIVTGVSFLIHVYSIGYMDHEEDYSRYFACLNFFVFAMLLLVLAGDALLLFAGWEAVGLASYLLIGFWYSHPPAASAATKAFVVNRVGDFGFLLALLLTFYLFGTSDMAQMFSKATESYPAGSMWMTVLTALFFVGAIGKSAQIPLHVWLPDAMEGPTPVSALIHAATMVTAGVYLVVRMNPIFSLAPDTLQAIGVIGGATSLFAAFCAVGQTDLKKVLAYSTVSQLGLMFLACGVGAFYAAMFHLMTHAFMKALLFLAAGNVIHMIGGKTEMKDMGGLAKVFTKTHVFFLIGVLAMSGIPPLAAFFSKDLILEQEYLTGHYVLFYVAVIASLLTGFYLTRAYCLTFLGKLKVNPSTPKTFHEAPNVMLVPVGILAFFSVIGGFIGAKPLLMSFLEKVGVGLAVEPHEPLFLFSYETWISIVIAFLGVGSSYLLYTQFKGMLSQNPVKVFKKAFYIDELYDYLIVKPYQYLCLFIANVIEPKIFGDSIRGIAKSTNYTAGAFQILQSGQIRSYAAWLVAGALFVILFFALHL